MATKLLLIDDDQVLGEVMRHRLLTEGYECDWKRDGAEGMVAMHENKPDLILLDIVMPVMNGYDFLEAMSGDPLYANIPVIVISNSGQPVEIERVLALGAKDYLVKAQFTPDEVLTKVQKILGPLSAASAALSPSPVEVSTEPEGKAPTDTKILIVEDEQILAELASGRFRSEGYEVFIAGDGQQCLEVAAREHPDIILLDVIMPIMNGFEALRRLKADSALADIPVVVFSNLAQDKEIEEGRTLGAVDFFVKAKMTPTEYVERVKAILAKRARDIRFGAV
ncbi:MAG: Histidine kinase [Candidatus Giovannonibacteria bacterium GW2011_GWA2_53_7]|uniref:Histidine kinase n=1 Tax=Candidatus Giovannonibacteria bacterium GW2011_GWA2_53_7 TaxID=1618650 RepID=A0A0G2A6M9_9BACT|nr:MAG: Histidine kinase [Candidatus Giovannonibacteria bacterium GW2011_GWA2_53_7]